MTLPRNAEKTRDWQRRSAETAAARRAERQLALARNGQRSTLSSVSRQRQARDVAEGRRRRSTLRRGDGFAVSVEQRAKVRGLASIVSGRTPCDPAHLWPRAMCGGCTSALDVVPLTRDEHELLDRGELDILPALIDHGCWAELAHAVEAHHADPLSLLHRLTGERHEPESTVLRRADELARKLIREGMVE